MGQMSTCQMRESLSKGLLHELQYETVSLLPLQCHTFSTIRAPPILYLYVSPTDPNLGKTITWAYVHQRERPTD